MGFLNRSHSGESNTTEILSEGVSIPAGSYVAYVKSTSNSRFIVIGFREVGNISHPNKITLNWRALPGKSSGAETLLASGTRANSASITETKGNEVQIVLSNEDTVSRSYNIYLTRKEV
jgi:hypothetical protein